jgi:hypothetical protein
MVASYGECPSLLAFGDGLSSTHDNLPGFNPHRPNWTLPPRVVSISDALPLPGSACAGTRGRDLTQRPNLKQKSHDRMVCACPHDRAGLGRMGSAADQAAHH